MGTAALSCEQANMYQASSFLFLVSCLSNVFCQRPYPPSPPPPSTPQYPTPAPVQDYNPDIGQTNRTQNEEICEPVMYKNCTGVIEINIERVCFNVNELVCNLVEAVHYETLEETYQVQRCFTGKDRVCDTTYDIDTTTK